MIRARDLLGKSFNWVGCACANAFVGEFIRYAWLHSMLGRKNGRNCFQSERIIKQVFLRSPSTQIETNLRGI